MKNLKVYFLASTLISTITLTSCKEVEETKAYNFETVTTVTSLETVNVQKKCELENVEFEIQTKKDVLEQELLNKKEITISFTGDCTLGTYATSQNRAFEVLFENQKDYAYYFKNVKEIFDNDDYTVVNLEGPLTNATSYQDKEFAFKGREDYVNILLEGSVEAANLSNNHIYDYYEEGYNDTINVLEKNGIAPFDNTIFHIEEIDGLKFGFAGFKAFNTYTKKEIDKALKYFEDNNVDIKIISLHGGIEYDYDFDSIKEELAHYSIDNGADLIVGHHPHILQGIEEYNGKYIIYSLGNFCYGGNRNPKDKNSAIAQVTFNFEDDKFIDSKLKIIPVSISSVENENNFQPTVLSEEKKEYVLLKIESLIKFIEYFEKHKKDTLLFTKDLVFKHFSVREDLLVFFETLKLFYSYLCFVNC